MDYGRRIIPFLCSRLGLDLSKKTALWRAPAKEFVLETFKELAFPSYFMCNWTSRYSDFVPSTRLHQVMMHAILFDLAPNTRTLGSERFHCECLCTITVGLLLLADRCWRAVLVSAEEPWPWRYIVTVKARTLRSGVFACTRRRPQPPHACGRYQQYSARDSIATPRLVSSDAGCFCAVETTVPACSVFVDDYFGPAAQCCWSSLYVSVSSLLNQKYFFFFFKPDSRQEDHTHAHTQTHTHT